MNCVASKIEYPKASAITTVPTKVPSAIQANYNRTFQYGFGDYYNYFNQFTPLTKCPICGEELQIKEANGLFSISHNPKCSVKVWGCAESHSQIESIWSSVIRKIKG